MLISRRGKRIAGFLAFLWVAIGGCAATAAEPSVRRFVPRIVAEYPSDPGAWTQGLVFQDGGFYESTGLHGRSSVRRVAPETGEILRMHSLPDAFYGEGLARIGNRLIQVTWKSGTGFVYRRSDLKRERTFSYDGQGWGLTWDGKRLILSDGTPELRFLDPETFAPKGRLRVTRNGEPVRNLNELEWVRGKIFANIWTTDWIAIIDPETGRVTGEFEVSELRRRLPPRPKAGPAAEAADAANGIAYDPDGDRLFLTGKFWPRVFEVRLEELAPGKPPNTSRSEKND